MLRAWQSECVHVALTKYKSGQRHVLCLATPGAGKTVMVAEVGACLIDQNIIDLIICFSPSRTVALGIRETFSRRLGCTFNGGLGSLGCSYTYQSMRTLGDDFWQNLEGYRILAVFDEIHHCSGLSSKDANSWGEEIISKIQHKAELTIAVTGTPWRSDTLPIVMSRYSNPEGRVQCDYAYGLYEAVRDDVCRSPNIVLVDNEKLQVRQEDAEYKLYGSLKELLEESDLSYLSVLSDEQAIKHVLGLGCKKLEGIRQQNPSAGGLVVAASVNHANQIAEMLRDHFQQSVIVVTYKHENAIDKINHFRNSNLQWVVSVGMISEGTDIPRLQVCCHLSSIRTELYFRQVLGRILRVTHGANQEAWLYTFAESSLTECAERVAQDIPEQHVIDIDYHFNNGAFASEVSCGDSEGSLSETSSLFVKSSTELSWSDDRDLGYIVDAVTEIEMLGHFRERLLRAFDMSR